VRTIRPIGRKREANNACCIDLLRLILGMSPAIADRPVTPQESGQLEAALKEQGCSGGKIEFDDGKFEVDNATCTDGKTYDLEFDSSFRLIKKKLPASITARSIAAQGHVCVNRAG
jgi:Peptidase propeptide and YPEB domain